MAKLTETQKAEQRQQLADFWSMDPEQLRGFRFSDLLAAAEDNGARVFWGCWTDEQLAETL